MVTGHRSAKGMRGGRGVVALAVAFERYGSRNGFLHQTTEGRCVNALAGRRVAGLGFKECLMWDQGARDMSARMGRSSKLLRMNTREITSLCSNGLLFEEHFSPPILLVVLLLQPPPSSCCYDTVAMLLLHIAFAGFAACFGGRCVAARPSYWYGFGCVLGWVQGVRGYRPFQGFWRPRNGFGF